MNTRQVARLLGRRGGRMRALRLSAQERERIAALGGRARSASLQVERRIVANLEYAAVLQELRGESTEVTRMGTFEGPLPGIYPFRR